MTITSIFRSDRARYEGVRPIQVYLLRFGYLLMVVFVATNSWITLLNREGDWTPMRVLAFSVWAAYPTLAVLGLIHPLRMLPIMLFTIFYKSLWLIFYAYPEWRAGTLAGPALEIARSFMGVPVLILAVPWGYVWRTYVLPQRPTPAAHGARGTAGASRAAGAEHPGERPEPAGPA